MERVHGHDGLTMVHFVDSEDGEAIFRQQPWWESVAA